MAQHLDVNYVNFYTQGSAVLKANTAIPLKPLILPRKRKLKRITLVIDPVATAGIIMAAVMMILMTVGAVQLANVRNEEAVMAAYVDTLQQENEKMTAEFQEGYDLAEVEKVALAMGMVPVEKAKQVTIQVDRAGHR